MKGETFVDDKETTIDLREVWALIVNGKWTIIKITAVILIVALAYVLLVPPTYQSTALLRVKQEKGLGDSILSTVSGGSADIAKQRMNTDAEILKSRNVIEPVIENVAERDKDGKLPTYDAWLKANVTTKPFKDTEILEVDVNGKSPEQAQDTNQQIVDGFLNRLSDLSHAENGATREFLEGRVASSKQELSDAEDKLEQYQVENKMYSTDDQIKNLTDKLGIVDKAKAENKLNLEQAQAALDTINGQIDSAGQSVADSPAIQQYKSQLATLSAERAGYIGKYTDEHPDVIAVNQKIAETQNALNNEIANIVAQQAPSSSPVQQQLLTDKFKNEAIVASEESKQKALEELDEENNKEINELPAKEQGFVRVKRDADVAQEIYVMLAKRLEEARIAENMVPNEVQVIDEPTLPEKPIKPRKVLIMAIALVLGLLLGSGYVVTKDMLNRRLRTSEDIENYLDLPVIGIIPDANSVRYQHKNQGLIDRIRGVFKGK